LKDLYELGIVVRGFIIVKAKFRDLPNHRENKEYKRELRGAFISAINSFASTAFNNLSLEYLESDNVLFMFKVGEIQTKDCASPEPIIMYGLADKKKKTSDKFVKKFLEKVSIILQIFISKYANCDFTEIDRFQPFKEEIKNIIMLK